MKNKLKLSLPLKISQIANKINQSLSKTLKEFDIAPEQRAILYMIESESLINQNELGLHLGKDKTTISRTLDVLEKKGYILRKYAKNDKRSKIITLTSLGKEAVNVTQPSIQYFREAVLYDISYEEVEKFFILLDKISLNIDRYNSEK
ncbi:hypothetical protein CRV08_07155 [Halarcobacter ebronensis]|uniref:HTH marR-type domain-containing protein n=1 Tax=Halarcobacter ebronensis TaxID=1462615 RepID=A0A4V1LRL3_9BACT|nr:MarR family transcriptional regulator [Halarcobacter ebronensis]RXJ68598.1 hypothetical protein CRV08_07155 [Halarcobacter ebronensis]